MSKIGVNNGVFKNQSSIIKAEFGGDCVYVGDSAFEGCSSLEEINDDNVIETIGSNAFAGTNIQSINFNKLTELYPNAFKACSKLDSINIPLCIKFPSGVFEGCENITNITIPRSTNTITIDENAFKKCTNLKNVYITETQTKIYDSAFYECSNLSNIDLSNCIEIGSNAFYGCKSLDTLNLNKCKIIGDHAFDTCSNLKQLTLSSCEIIGVNSFVDCNNLTKVYIKNPTDVFCSLSDKFAFCTYDSNTEEYTPIKNILFYIDLEVIDNYKNDENWGIYKDYMLPLVRNNQLLYKSDRNELLNNNINDNIINLIDEEKCIYDDTTKIGYIQFNEIVTSLSQIFKDPSHITSVDIPSECKIIGEKAFEGYTNLTNIMLSNTINEICEYAFKDCKSLTSFEIPTSVEKLSEGIFAGCENIENFYGKYSDKNNIAVVYKSTLISVAPKNDLDVTGGQFHFISAINNYITTLGKHCFHGCKKMRRLDIHSTVRSINDNAFEGCKNLCEMRIYGKINSFGENIFGEPYVESDGVSKLNLRDDFKIFVPESELLYYSNGLKSILLDKYIYPFTTSNDIFIYSEEELNGSGITPVIKECTNGKYYKLKSSTITSNKFENTNIEKVILGDAVTTINKNAFKNCSKLSYIYLPDSIVSLGDNCFEGCTELTRIHIPSGIKNFTDYFTKTNGYIYTNNNIKLGNDIFYRCSKLKEFGSYIIKSISDDNRCYIDYKNAELKFFAQGSLSNEEKNYKIPKSIVSIGRSAFRGSEINKITIGNITISGRQTIYDNSLMYISQYAFEGCSSLTSIDGCKYVKSISTGAFMNCVELGEVTLPDGLETISEQAFKGCKKLRINNIPSTVTNLGKSAFEGALNTLSENEASDITLTLPNITTINESVFNGCTKLKTITIKENTTTINNKAFQGCSNLTTVTLSKNTTLNYINDYAFQNCKKLKTFQLPESLKNMGGYVFKDCESYNPIIPAKLEKMGQGCFYNSGIEALSLKNCSLLIEIPPEAFYKCTKLKTIEMGDYIQIINPYSFADCNNLLCDGDGTLILSNNITNIGDFAFNNCLYISSVTLPTKLKTIGDYCFNPNQRSNNIILKIIITKDFESLPIFTKYGYDTESSMPFGTYSSYISQPSNLKISLSNKFEDSIYSNNYWKKYINNITINSDYTPPSYSVGDYDIPIIQPITPITPSVPILPVQ